MKENISKILGIISIIAFFAFIAFLIHSANQKEEEVVMPHLGERQAAAMEAMDNTVVGVVDEKRDAMGFHVLLQDTTDGAIYGIEFYEQSETRIKRAVRLK